LVDANFLTMTPNNRIKIVAACSVLLLGGSALPLQSTAQSVVTEVPRSSTAYVPMYSTCRVVPPSDAAAQALFKALWPSKDFAEYKRQLDLLRAKPIEGLSAAEAEAYFLLLRNLEIQVLIARGGTSESRRAVVLEGRQYGTPIAERFRDDSFVRCAFLGSEAWILNELPDRFDGQARRKARDDYIAFIESALRGEVRTDTYRDLLQSTVGQYYLDSGFELLPDTTKAAPLFEAGARHVCDAASNPKDDRYLANWRRYAFMLQKLPLEQQLEITQRLLTHLEKTWGGKSARAAAALDVYLHVLSFAGESALAAKKGKDAVSIFVRHLEVVQELRRRDPHDPNHQVSEALGYLLVGDAYILDGDPAAAAPAYQSAQRVFKSSSASAKDMLKFQDFPDELESRRKAIR
jgi:hypothetical protein